MTQNVVNLKISGLHTNNNYLQEVPAGSFSRCDDYNIDRLGVLEKREGFAVYSDFDSVMNTPASQLLEYRGRIVRHHETNIDIDRGDSTFFGYAGSYTAPSTEQRIKSLQANGNLYFTTDTGIKKISASSDAQLLETRIREAGAVESLSIETSIIAGPSWLSPLSKSIYRVVWGYYDNNQNLLLGSPSDFSIVINDDLTDSKAVRLKTNIPEEATENKNYFYRIYRGAVYSVDDIADLDLVTPQDELNLVIEDFPTSTDYTNGYIEIDDTVPDSFREGGTLLYTNAISGEGISGANVEPPIAVDIAEYKNYTFYANTKTRHILDFSLVSVDNFATDGTDKFVIYSGGTIEQFPYKSVADESLGEVQLSSSSSVGLAVEETAKSLVRAINNTSTLVYAYYTSGVTDFPGNITLKARDLSDDKIYIAVDGDLGNEYIPTLPKINETISYTSGSQTIINDLPNNLSVGDSIIIYDTPGLNGVYFVQSIGASDFTIDLETASDDDLNYVQGSTSSSNFEFQNRVYYSKFQQPEAVPSLNFFDVGSKDSPILRIFGLRDSLFVLKKDAIYRLSGESPQSFIVSLFDASTDVLSADSASILNNQIYCLTTQGIVSISDTGVSIISKEIEDLIDRINLNTNFAKLCFSVASENEGSYMLFSPETKESLVADQVFRYSVDTQTWTRWRLEKTCGILNRQDDRIYLGAYDVNHIEKQRKDRERTDFADREFKTTLQPNGISNNTISGFININTINYTDGGTYRIEVGDVIRQDQYVTLSQFNSLLRKLDVDQTLKRSDINIVTGINTNIIFDSNHNFENNDFIIINDVESSASEILNGTHEITVISPTQIQLNVNTNIYSAIGGTIRYSYENNLTASAGDDMGQNLKVLLSKLQTYLDNKYYDDNTLVFTDINGNDSFDTTSVYIASNEISQFNTFLDTADSQDDQVVFNLMIDRLNAHPNVFLTNYKKLEGFKTYEEVVVSINRNKNTLETLTIPTFVYGQVTVFKAIESIVVWNPNPAGDPALMKQASEGTILFKDKSFTQGLIEYTTDLSTGFDGQAFFAEGSSMFGQYPFGAQGFGGVASARPARITIPRNKSRFRFISPRMTHRIALENISIYGMSLFVRSVSQRAYRGFRGF